MCGEGRAAAAFDHLVLPEALPVASAAGGDPAASAAEVAPVCVIGLVKSIHCMCVCVQLQDLQARISSLMQPPPTAPATMPAAPPPPPPAVAPKVGAIVIRQSIWNSLSMLMRVCGIRSGRCLSCTPSSRMAARCHCCLWNL